MMGELDVLMAAIAVPVFILAGLCYVEYLCRFFMERSG